MTAFETYWKVYGGWREVLFSPYFFFACVFSIACWPVLVIPSEDSFVWVGWAISALSGILSFSLGAMAIFLAFANEAFLKLLRQRGVQSSYLMTVVTAFFHFIVVQFLAIGGCVVVIAYENVYLSGVSFLLCSYAMACGLAAAAALVDAAEILNAMGRFDEDDV